ncbi:hypothetical protein AGMMS49942_25380 [Spirochaetia bacterium]|nr:hypothetical protein AGMMS49942_25380 [Spirochaetia bacterium]
MLKGNVGNEYPLVYVGDSAEFVMYDGTITGNTYSKEGEDCAGGGVNVENGTFTMKGGTISGNTADAGGGVYVEEGTFTMSGGTISGNTAAMGGGVAVIVGEDGGTFTKTGGTIHDNAAGGAGYGNQVFVMSEDGGKYRDDNAGPEVKLDSNTDDGWVVME